MANFCRDCGSRLDSNTGKCPKCDQLTIVEKKEISNKSKLIAGFLGIFLGGFGVHNFYLGNIGRGISQILVTFSTCFTGFIWGFIEGILILTGNISEDANGYKLK